MPDPVVDPNLNLNPGAVVDPPIVDPPPAADPAEALDPAGVPWKNRFAEYQRKLDEATTEISRYREELGRTRQTPAPAAPSPGGEDIEKLFDEPTKKFVRGMIEREGRKVAEQVTYDLLHRAANQQVLSADSALREEAERQFNHLTSDPIWSTATANQREAFAITQAKATLLERGRQATQQTAVRSQSAGATLPSTGGSSQPASSVDAKKESFISNYTSSPLHINEFKSWFRGTDINSEAGKQKFRRVAEHAYEESAR